MESTGELPKSWRLGTRPNLKQMHHQAVERVAPELVEMRLGEFLQKEKRLTSVANQLGVRVHNLPKRPPDVQDDRDFHYVVLGPSAASESGKPSPEAQKYIKEKSLSGDPRVYRNAILLLVPAKDGLDLLRARVQDYLGWEEVARLPDVGTLDDTIRALLRGHIENARKKIPEAVLQAYCIVVTVSSKGEIEAFKITPEDKPLFEIIKADKRSRILDQPFNPEALLPGGPYDLWQKGELKRCNFCQTQQNPKLLRYVRFCVYFPHSKRGGDWGA